MSVGRAPKVAWVRKRAAATRSAGFSALFGLVVELGSPLPPQAISNMEAANAIALPRRAVNSMLRWDTMSSWSAGWWALKRCGMALIPLEGDLRILDGFAVIAWASRTSGNVQPTGVCDNGPHQFFNTSVVKRVDGGHHGGYGCFPMQSIRCREQNNFNDPMPAATVGP